MHIHKTTNIKVPWLLTKKEGNAYYYESVHTRTLTTMEGLESGIVIPINREKNVCKAYFVEYTTSYLFVVVNDLMKYLDLCLDLLDPYFL